MFIWFQVRLHRYMNAGAVTFETGRNGESHIVLPQASLSPLVDNKAFQSRAVNRGSAHVYRTTRTLPGHLDRSVPPSDHGRYYNTDGTCMPTILTRTLTMLLLRWCRWCQAPAFSRWAFPWDQMDWCNTICRSPCPQKQNVKASACSRTKTAIRREMKLGIFHVTLSQKFQRNLKQETRHRKGGPTCQSDKTKVCRNRFWWTEIVQCTCLCMM